MFIQLQTRTCKDNAQRNLLNPDMIKYMQNIQNYFFFLKQNLSYEKILFHIPD